MFVQAMLVEVPPRVGDVGAMSLAKIAALPGASIVTSPSLIVIDGVTATFATGPEPVVQLAVTSEMLAEDVAWLDVLLTGDGEASTSELIHSGQTIALAGRAWHVRGPQTPRSSARTRFAPVLAAPAGFRDRRRSSPLAPCPPPGNGQVGLRDVGYVATFNRPGTVG